MSRLPRNLKRWLKPLHRRTRRGLARLLFAYSPQQLQTALGEIGIASGDTLFLHSGFRSSSGFSGGPREVVDCCERAVAPDGNLLMMSMPYRGASETYAADDPLFDVLRTPSAMGLISEVFRRQPAVARSLSPLHPVLAHGPLAAWLTADHDKISRSCGKGSPFERFLTIRGKLLFYDAPYSSMTFMHYVEDRFRAELPVPLYAEETVSVRVRDHRGEEFKVRQQAFGAQARARRDFAVIEKLLDTRSLIRRARVGNSRLVCVQARDVLDCARELVETGTGFYT